jgi:hypothetical protein
MEGVSDADADAGIGVGAGADGSAEIDGEASASAFDAPERTATAGDGRDAGGQALQRARPMLSAVAAARLYPMAGRVTTDQRRCQPESPSGDEPAEDRRGRPRPGLRA